MIFSEQTNGNRETYPAVSCKQIPQKAIFLFTPKPKTANVSQIYYFMGSPNSKIYYKNVLKENTNII